MAQNAMSWPLERPESQYPLVVVTELLGPVHVKRRSQMYQHIELEIWQTRFPNPLFVLIELHSGGVSINDDELMRHECTAKMLQHIATRWVAHYERMSR